MRSLRDILNHTPEPIKIKAEDFKWEELYGEKYIREFLGKAVAVDEPYTIVAEYGFKPTGGYGQMLRETFEVVKLSDGRYLALAETSEFAGTFASHDTIAVSYYGLTPLPAALPEDKPKKKRKR